MFLDSVVIPRDATVTGMEVRLTGSSERNCRYNVSKHRHCMMKKILTSPNMASSFGL